MNHIPNQLQELPPPVQDKLTARTESGRRECRVIVEHALAMGWIKLGVAQDWARPPERKGAWEWSKLL